MIYALSDGRTHVRINAARALGVKGEAAGSAVPNLGLACRDSIAQVRRESAKALGKLGGEALPAVPDLVGALSGRRGRGGRGARRRSSRWGRVRARGWSVASRPAARRAAGGSGS